MMQLWQTLQHWSADNDARRRLQ